jgi:arginine decarboxylase
MNTFKGTPWNRPLVDNGNYVAKEMFFTKGVGRHQEKLTSFELGLRSAGIAALNIVRVSSIFPPHCKEVSKDEGVKKLKPGQVAFVVLAETASNEPHRLVGSSIGCAIPTDPSQYGYLSEHHAYGMTEEKCGDYAEDLAAFMLASTLGLVDQDAIKWDENKTEWRISDKIVRTRNETIVAEVGEDGRWTTAIAAAVLLL